MKKIAQDVKKANNQIRNRFEADLKRAGSYKSCASVAKDKSIKATKRLLADIGSMTDKRIIKSVQVCGTDCLTVSFARDVADIRALLTKASADVQKYAKKVVTCAKSTKPSTGGKNGPRTDDALSQIVKDTKNIVTHCTVCKKK